MKHHSLKRLTLSAVFLAMGVVLPLLTMQIKEIGDSLLPMHLPVLLCGALCGKRHGAAVGLILPPMRSLLFGMPPIYPNAVYMALELATYGFVIGLLYHRARDRRLYRLYASLIAAMLAGRAVWGAAKALLLGIRGEGFPFAAFIAGGFADALPGILLQLLLVPFLVKISERFIT